MSAPTRRDLMRMASFALPAWDALAQAPPVKKPDVPAATATMGPQVPEGTIGAANTGPFAGWRWRVSYQFDELNMRCRLQQFAMPTPKFGLGAMLVVDQDRDRVHAELLVTHDGGGSWMRQKCEKDPLGVAVYGASHGWVVHPGKLGATVDGGATWKRYALPNSEIMHVHFNSERDGWAYGRGKSFYRSSDGGVSWTVVEESAKVELHSPETYLRSIEMLPSGSGILAGDSTSRPPEGGTLPDWMIPDRALSRKVVPGTAILYETNDHGKSWMSSLSSVFGHVRRVRLGKATVVAVFQYGEAFAWPSELYEFELHGSKFRTLLRRKDLVLQDVLPVEGGGLLVAAMQPSGRLRNSPVPAKLRIFWTPDRAQWFEMKVDYRAMGSEAAFEACSDGTVWVATDEGVVVSLSQR